MEEKQETKKTIKISLRTAILIVIIALIAIGVTAYFFIKDNKEENTNTNIVKENKVEKEVEETVELTEFTPKSFEQKYVDLYNIVKGSEKVVNGITYSYRTNEVNNSIDNALIEGIIELDVSDKLNIIANTIDVNEIKTVQDIKEIIKKYYGIDEKGQFPETLDIITGTNQVTHFGKQDNNYQMQAQSGIANVNRYVLGLLDKVEDTGDTIVIKEKVVFVREGNNEITFGNGIWLDYNITKSKKIEQFDIGKYYDELVSYEYTFKKNGDNYNLIDVQFKTAVEEESYAYKYFNEGLEIETLLPKNESLKITNIEKDSEGNFTITGNVYEECTISKETLEDLKNGKTINLNGREYKYDYKKGTKTIVIKEAEQKYEIEQLIPIDGETGIYLIGELNNDNEKMFTSYYNKNIINLFYVRTNDFVESIGTLESPNGYEMLIEKRPLKTITITVKNIKSYGCYYMGEFGSDLLISDLENLYKEYKEKGEVFYNTCLNFIMKDGEAIEFWTSSVNW